MATGKQKIFFSGIGGSGISAIASLMADKGHAVTGSDRAFAKNPYHPALRAFRNKGIAIVPQDGSGIDGTIDLVVCSTAVESDQPEIVKARALGIPLKTRPEFLADLVGQFRTIAVAGTSGKSTTAGLLAFLMQRLGMDPNYIGGGRVKRFRSGTNPGNALAGDSDLLVIEACESDGSIIHYQPEHTILLNLDLDHHAIDETARMFGPLVDQTRGKVVVNADDINLVSVPSERMKNAITFALDAEAGYRPDSVTHYPLKTVFRLRGIDFTLEIPGRYNLSNALACIALLAEIGAPLDRISAAMPEFDGIERRFDIHYDDGTRLVIDDYAHNPHKLASLMAAVKPFRKSICYIFQPHGFGPTRLMKDGYIEAFAAGLRREDHLILLPIFYAGGTAAQDISSHDLASGIKKAGGSVEVVKDRNEIIRRIDKYDSYIIAGARDETLSDFARAIALLMGMD